MNQKLKPLHVSRLRDILERHDARGQRVPVSICYACMNGGLVDIREPCIVCVGVDTIHHTHTLKSLTSGQIRTVRDILILRVNEAKIIVN